MPRTMSRLMNQGIPSSKDAFESSKFGEQSFPIQCRHKIISDIKDVIIKANEAGKYHTEVVYNTNCPGSIIEAIKIELQEKGYKIMNVGGDWFSFSWENPK